MPMVVSVLGAVVFAAAAVGSTVVMGHVTDTVITPALSGSPRRHGVSSGVVLGAVLLVVLVGTARGLSVVVRRYFAAMLEARMQATLRRVRDRMHENKRWDASQIPQALERDTILDMYMPSYDLVFHEGEDRKSVV